MKDSILVRPAIAEDVPAIVNFALALAAESEDKILDAATVTRGARAFIAQPQYGFYLVAEAEGHIAGSVMVTIEYSDWRDGLYWWIQSVYVLPRFRRRGIYRRLYETVKERAARDGRIRGFRLYVDRGNTLGRTVYKSLGMKPTSFEVMEEPVE